MPPAGMRLGSQAGLSSHVHCLVLHGVYRRSADGATTSFVVDAPTDKALHALLRSTMTGLMKLLADRRVLVEEIQTWTAEPDAHGDEARTLQAAAITHRIAFGPALGATHSRQAGGVEAQDTAARRQHAPGDVADGFIQRLAALVLQPSPHLPLAASWLSISAIGCPVWV